MKKQFPSIELNKGLRVAYKVIANFRDTKISIYLSYDGSPFTKMYVSTGFLGREDIIKIMFEYDARDLRNFILSENFTAGKIRVYSPVK